MIKNGDLPNIIYALAYPFTEWAPSKNSAKYLSDNNCKTAIATYYKKTEYDKLKHVLMELEEYFDDLSDADMDQDGYLPNKEMKHLVAIREVLK